MAHSHTSALYFAFAGVAFEMQCLGRWWACLPRSDWPEDAAEVIIADFDGDDNVGDRRNEIVFIGDNFGIKGNEERAELEESLRACLLNKDEMVDYEKCLTGGYGEEAEAAVDSKVSEMFPLPTTFAIRTIDE